MKQEYIDALARAYTSVCECGHAADLHAHHNGHSHPGDTALGVCGCVLSGTQAALIAQAVTIAHQRQTIDALTAALESLLDWADGYSSLPDNYTRRNARSTLDALEKARGESNA